MGIEIVEQKPKMEVFPPKDVFLSGVKVGEIEEGSGETFFHAVIKRGEFGVGGCYGQGIAATADEAIRKGIAEARDSAEQGLAYVKEIFCQYGDLDMESWKKPSKEKNVDGSSVLHCGVAWREVQLQLHREK